MLNTDDSRKMYFHMAFIFAGEGDYRRAGQIVGIDVVLSR
jgi:hypothetical protein